VRQLAFQIRYPFKFLRKCFLSLPQYSFQSLNINPAILAFDSEGVVLASSKALFKVHILYLQEAYLTRLTVP
jgi:hypothetical protein